MTALSWENGVVRAVRADEWKNARELRLDALRDPVAHLAFMETYQDAVSRPDSFWQERVERAAAGVHGVRQFVAETHDGRWVGTVTVLVEEAGATDWAGLPVERRQGHAVAVYVRPECRGSGVIDALFEAVSEWSWQRGLERVRLLVHRDNQRARAAYGRLGFLPTGVTMSLVEGEETDAELELARERAA
ncbi:MULTISPECIES: GNAT family N-acetyltransferase [unclassified Streptomyces]|uniref:GNAT family N-acetyltransferase n=1 Tax=unclassified Streptomyces TaxID=2593676 RepID=UPI003D7274BC